ncbi:MULTISPECIES: YtxH domain-containing protein [unclassified Psychrobacillus]|uniref:YtxH domain-containing protein n=1 Tax=unclassified Psychrobacillus TaxID=2636677 RepID=UPI002040B109|nr:YtxH domain-containing protein [Psychrobacillus sp. MER TA 171]MCM3359057.1 YtxH domain-containing protein [Psychrobacillus sp. MER TA 171]
MTQFATYNNELTNTEEEKNGKLIKGLVVGAVIGAAIAMLDSNTRNKVTSTTKNVKDSTLDMYSQVRNNPGEVKNDLQERLKSASTVLKDAINDAQSLYEKVNENILAPVSQVKEDSSGIISSAKEITSDIKEISGKVKEAGEEVVDGSNGNNHTKI